MNPYTPSSSQLFYGRETFLEELLKDESRGQSVVLVGGRRCGKTRALQRIRDYLVAVATGTDRRTAWERAVPDRLSEAPPVSEGATHWPVHLDVEGNFFASLEDLFAALAGWIADGFPENVPAPAAPPPGGVTPSEFGRWLEEAVRGLERAGFAGLALMLDQVEAFFDFPWHENLMSFLRSRDDLGGLGTRIWLVLAGSNSLNDYRHRDGSPPLNTARMAYLFDLGPGPRKRMMREPFALAGRPPLSDDVVASVDAQAGGNVWLLTHALEYLFDQERPEVRDLEEFIGDFLDRNSDILQRWASPVEDLGAWKLYQQICRQGIVRSEDVSGADRDARLLLEYESLVHRRSDRSIEVGPAIFRTWATEHGKIEGRFTDRVPDPEGDPPAGRYEYDVALSYAGPQVEFARTIAGELRAAGRGVFFSEERQGDLWGVDLARCLPETYDRSAKLVLLLVSSDYVDRAWPQVEARVAVTRALRDGSDVVLMVSIDGAILPDVPDSVVRLETTADEAGAKAVALKVLQRLRA